MEIFPALNVALDPLNASEAQYMYKVNFSPFLPDSVGKGAGS